MSRNVDPGMARLRGQLSGHVRSGREAEATETRRELRVAMAEKHIRELVAGWPLPTPEQRDRLIGLLRVEGE